ncbi:MAG: hypothetical protein M3304_11100 [Actinomycetota bacterium]|nr:hypothetical protein [Actinomycetota bacterium]
MPIAVLAGTRRRLDLLGSGSREAWTLAGPLLAGWSVGRTPVGGDGTVPPVGAIAGG